MTPFYPSVASTSASRTSSNVSSANEAATFLSSSRVRTGASDFRVLPEAKRPRSSASHSRPALPVRCFPAMTGPRPVATSSSAQDWVNAVLPPTPALQTCTYDPNSAQTRAVPNVSYRKHEAPLAPTLDSRFAHCPTPELTPPEDAMAVDPAAASYSRPAASSSTTFIKRDDLTAKAIARAASMSMPAQPTLPHKQFSTGSESSSTASGQPSEKDRLVSSLVGELQILRPSIRASIRQVEDLLASRLFFQALPFLRSSRSGVRLSLRLSAASLSRLEPTA